MEKRDMSGVYILELEGDRYYVGFSENYEARINDHFMELGCEWTRIYKPIKVHDKIPGGTLMDESNVTLGLMKKYGIDKVRGGPWVQIKLEDPPYRQMAHISGACFRCFRHGHMSSACKEQYTLYGFKIEEKNANKPPEKCERCGRKGHGKFSCEYIQDIMGNKISGMRSSFATSPGKCFRCGRTGHWKYQCYASTHLSGRRLKDAAPAKVPYRREEKEVEGDSRPKEITTEQRTELFRNLGEIHENNTHGWTETGEKKEEPYGMGDVKVASMIVLKALKKHHGHSEIEIKRERTKSQKKRFNEVLRTSKEDYEC